MEAVIKAGKVSLAGDLVVPHGAKGVVIFVHGSGSSRLSPRNKYVARVLQEAGIATLLMDLLTEEEEMLDLQTGELRFNVEFLAERLIKATQWLRKQPKAKNLARGYFGASTGAAAALIAAAKGQNICAVVSRGGRPDLARSYLAQVKAPTLLIVGGEDKMVIELNEDALKELRAIKKLGIVPRATHLFEEPGTLEQVAKLATAWFKRYLK